MRDQLQANEQQAYRFTSNLFGHQLPNVSVRLDEMGDEVLRVKVAADVKDVLQRQGLTIDQEAGHPITLRRTLQQTEGGMQRSTWTLALPDTPAEGGRVLEHSALMPAGARPSTEAAVALATVNRHLSEIRRWASQMNTK